jgi:hypothetical protein
MHLSIFGYKLDVQLIILAGIIYTIMALNTVCGCCKISLKNGMTSATKELKEGFSNFGNRNSSPYSFENPLPAVNASSWVAPDLSNIMSSGSQDILNRPEQPVPLPKGQMSFFNTTSFSPSCCPNAYSTSSGCACMTKKQYEYIRNRGGNTDTFGTV